MSNALNHADVFTRSDGRFDFRIIAAENGKTLCSSNQGYENREECVQIAKRALFGPADPTITFDARPSEIATTQETP